jgi:hypothetical protein
MAMPTLHSQPTGLCKPLLPYRLRSSRRLDKSSGPLLQTQSCMKMRLSISRVSVSNSANPMMLYCANIYDLDERIKS